ncbi:MAG: hypothetical protein MN733_26615 [Nitrososphaera sp.]|nr:hypothetical protein [Nitrososphaera sp.]
MSVLPNPGCTMGFPSVQLQGILGSFFYPQFLKWMNGQTIAHCDGRAYNHEKKCYEKTTCTHGPSTIFYVDDVRRYVNGLPVVD